MLDQNTKYLLLAFESLQRNCSFLSVNDIVLILTNCWNEASYNIVVYLQKEFPDMTLNQCEEIAGRLHFAGIGVFD
jgi:hypothetical protein